VVAVAWLFASLFKGILILFAGILFGIFLNGMSKQVATWLSLNYKPAFALVVTVLLFFLVGTIFLLGSQISASIEQFAREFQTAQDLLVKRLDGSAWWSKAVDSVQESSSSGLPMKAVSTATSTATSVAAVVIAIFTGMLLVTFLGFYFALQPEIYRQGLLALIPHDRQPRAKQLLERLTNTLWKWLLGRLVGMAVIGTSSGIGLALIGVPLPATLGVLAGVLTFVPNMGPALSVIPPLLFSFQLGGYCWVYVLILYGTLQFFESYFLTPIIIQHQVGLPPGLTLSSQLLFSMLAGFLGLLLATPLTAVIQVLIDELYVKAPAKRIASPTQSVESLT
jgi:predicted PurR-regulated permease PerM